MGTTPTDSHHLQLNQFSSTNLIEYPCTSISESLHVRLPHELIIEILLRLPVKSLLKFRCVSRSWLSLISSHQFVKSHFSTSSSGADRCLNSQVLFPMLDPIRGITSIKKFSLYSAFYEHSVNVVDIEYPTQKPNQFLQIVGIVNGLVCLLIGAKDSLLLWNPVLRKSKILPRVNFSDKGFRYVAHGFAYVESNDDYKVVCVASEYPYESGNKTVVKVYSLLTDSWRRIEDFKGWLPLDCSGKYANGKIHWTASCSAREWKIVNLDMVSEKYGELQRPDYEGGVCDWVFEVLGGRLSVLCGYDKKKGDLWVMDEYGVEESWSKVVSIPYDNVHPAKPYFMHRIVCILRNGEILLSDGGLDLLHVSKRKEFRKIDLGGCKGWNFLVYVESLVSPNGSGLSADKINK